MVVCSCCYLGPAVERENFDRESMLLPGLQPQLLKDVMLYGNQTINL